MYVKITGKPEVYRIDGSEPDGVWLEEIRLERNGVIYTENYIFVERERTATYCNEEEELEFEQFTSSMEPYHDPEDFKAPIAF